MALTGAVRGADIFTTTVWQLPSNPPHGTDGPRRFPCTLKRRATQLQEQEVFFNDLLRRLDKKKARLCAAPGERECLLASPI
jgi:hypothetical protein